MSQQWTVDFGDFKVEDVEADTRSEARDRAIERLQDRVHDAEVTPKYSVYEVRQHCTGCRINVRAMSASQAESAVRAYTEKQIGELEKDAQGTARSLLQDLNRGAEVIEEVGNGHYEITENGVREEGCIE